MRGKTIRISDPRVVAKAIKSVRPPRTSRPAIRVWDSTKSWPWESPAVVRRQPSRDQQSAFAPHPAAFVSAYNRAGGELRWRRSTPTLLIFRRRRRG
jgi:hypothetical protein